MYVQDCMKTENMLLAAQQTVVTLTAQLHTSEEKLTSIEDLIGELRTRMYMHGLESHQVVEWGCQLPRFAPVISST